MNSLQSASCFLYQYTYSQDNEELLNTCVTYLDKLIEIWAEMGFVLVCDNTNSGIYQMQSDVYIHQCTIPTTVMQYNSQIKAIISSGVFKNRSIEVIGVYTKQQQDGVKAFRKQDPVVVCFFLSGKDNKEFYTFQTVNMQRTNIDNRAQVIQLLSIIMHDTIQVVPLFQVQKIQQFDLPTGDARSVNENWLRLFKDILQPSDKKQMKIVQRFAELQPIFLSGLVTQFLQKVVPQKTAKLFLEYFMQNAAFLNEKYLVSTKLSRNKGQDMLKLRIFKHFYNKIYGYDPKISEIQSMEQFYNYTDPQIRNAIEMQVHNLMISKDIASKCSHKQCADEDKLTEQFLDLNALKVSADDIQAEDAKTAKNTVRLQIAGVEIVLPYDMLPCAKCEQPLICGHRLIIREIEAASEDDPRLDELHAALEQFAVVVIGGSRMTLCSICGAFLALKRDEVIQQDLIVSGDDIKEMAQRKGYSRCQRVTSYALQCLITDGNYYTMNFIMDVYTNIYPQVKLMVLDFKPDHDYTQRKMHALIICVAAYFANVQKTTTGKTTIIFDINKYYKNFAQKRELQINFVDFQKQVDDLQKLPYVKSSIVLKEPTREQQFLRLLSKPFLTRFIQHIGVQSIEELHDFILKHPLRPKLLSKEGRIELNDVYSILIYELLKQKNISIPQLSNSAGYDLRQYLYSKSVQQLRDIDMLEYALYLNSIEPIAVSSRFQWIVDETNSAISYAKYRGCSMTDLKGAAQQEIFKHDVPFAQKYIPHVTLIQTAEHINEEIARFYQIYCKQREKIDFHLFVEGTCSKCGYKQGQAGQQVSAEVYAADLHQVINNKRALTFEKRIINQDMSKLMLAVMQTYKEKDIQHVANAMGLKNIQLLNLGGFDYIGYDETVQSQSATPLKIIQFTKQQHLSVYRKEALIRIEQKLSSDLDYVKDIQIDWGVFRNRFNRIQNHIRSFIFKCGMQSAKSLANLSEAIDTLQTLHKNFYIHSQILIYYFAVHLLPELQKNTNPQMITQFFIEMCKADSAISARISKEAKFGLHVAGDREMRLFNDDEVDENAEVLAEDEVSDILP